MTDIPQQDRGSSPISVPVKDRRLHARQRVSSLTYVDLGENNGGIVLNVSEAGIRIQAAAALELGPISLRLQLPGTRKRLELNAEVIWVGPSRKEAGLYFMNLSEDARSQIRNWIAGEASPEAFRGEDESDSDAEPTQVEPAVTEEAAFESAAAVAEETVGDDEVAVEDEYPIENEFPSENEFAAEEDPVVEREQPSEEATGEAAEEEFVETPEQASEDVPEEIAEEIEAPVEARTTEGEVPHARIPEFPREQPAAALFKTPVPIAAKAPETPLSTFDGISGTHGAPSMGFPSPARLAPRPSAIGGDAPLFVKPHRPAQIPDDDGRTSYRVKLQSGWFVAALILLLALISFLAGMAVRRGALNSVIGQSDEPVHPRSAPPPTTDTSSSAPPAGASTDQPSEATAKPLEIEVVDSNGRRWEVPAAAGANHPDASAAAESSPSETATPAPDEAAPPARKTTGARSSAQDASSVGVGMTAGDEKAGAPLMLTLPETPISASGSVAIRARGVVPVPPGAAKSAQKGRNLQIGQLTNLVEPVYPPDAQKRGIEGTVKLHAVIGVDGTIQSLESRSGPEPLIQAAMTAVRQWKYNPTTLNGKPIETQEDVSFAFRLPK
jgi:TonB family protein